MLGRAYGGGAARGPAAAGAGAARPRAYKIVGGTSVGSVTAAHMAQYEVGCEAQGYADLEERWMALVTKRVHKAHLPFGKIMGLICKLSARSIKPLRKYLETALSPQKIKDSGRGLVITAVTRETRELVVYTEKDADDIVDIVMASCAIPMAFAPQYVRGLELVDGGVRCVVPVGPLAERGCTEIDAFCCFPKQLPIPESPKNMLDVGFQAIDTQNHEIQENDLRDVPAGVTVNVWRPDRDLGDGMDFSRETNAWRWQLGASSAEHIETIAT